MKSNVNVLLLTISVMAVLFLLMPISLAETVYIYGYVKYDNTPINGVIVSLIGGFPGNRSNVTAFNGTAGYYQFAIENGSNSWYTVTASYNWSYISYNLSVPESDADTSIRRDLDIPLVLSTPTPTPTPTATPTPTPRPSGELGGMVIRNDSSYFIPMSALNPTTPTPKPSKAAPAPTITPTPTPTPAGGVFSNMYMWLVIVMVAILAIAAAVLLYLRK